MTGPINREDYEEPLCLLNMERGDDVPAGRVDIRRVSEKLDEYLRKCDYDGAERHVKYWLAEAEAERDLTATRANAKRRLPPRIRGLRSPKSWGIPAPSPGRPRCSTPPRSINGSAIRSELIRFIRRRRIFTNRSFPAGNTGSAGFTTIWRSRWRT